MWHGIGATSAELPKDRVRKTFDCKGGHFSLCTSIVYNVVLLRYGDFMIFLIRRFDVEIAGSFEKRQKYVSLH